MRERKFQTYRITLKTLSSLHIGTGAEEALPRERLNDETVDVTVQKIALDHQDKPYIPATQIKGAMRALCRDQIESLFGYQGETPKEGDAEGLGGKLLFTNAYCTQDICYKNNDAPTSEHTSICPETGAGKSHHLFSLQYVPEGAEFSFDIVVLDQDRLTEDEAEIFQRLIASCQENGLILGANVTNGWGRCQFNGGRTRPVPPYTALIFDITLSFQTPFIVNDPKNVKSNEERQDGDPTAVYKKSTNGRALLPASSFRGAFSHQFGRIARTRGEDPESKLFGDTNYQALLTFSDFLSDKEARDMEQDFVAIDRFTGGAKDGAKFKAKTAVNPTLKGKMTLNTDRFSKIKDQDRELNLLLLTLRDLIEGDVTFGYGSSKGYGVCTASVTLSGDHPRKEKMQHYLSSLLPQKAVC